MPTLEFSCTLTTQIFTPADILAYFSALLVGSEVGSASG